MQSSAHSGSEAQVLGRLTEKRNTGAYVSSALALDNLTGMQLEAGKIKGARGKEVQYIRDKAV